MSEERIQRILARAGILSRRKAKELLREGRVTVNGQVAEIGGKADPERDAIKVDGRRVQQRLGPHRYLLLNKPKGVLTTVSDPQGRKTVIDFVPPMFRKALVPVGRLDYNSEGLILLTDDGEFAQHVAHPRYGGMKTYEVKVKGRPNESQLNRLREGILIGDRRTAPTRIAPRPVETRRDRRRGKRHVADEGEGEGNSWWVVELTEGRTRQIREMFFQVGHPVQKLRRVAIGPLRDPHLPVGALRELTEREVELLRRVTARPKKPIVAFTKPERHSSSGGVNVPVRSSSDRQARGATRTVTLPGGLSSQLKTEGASRKATAGRPKRLARPSKSAPVGKPTHERKLSARLHRKEAGARRLAKAKEDES